MAIETANLTPKLFIVTTVLNFTFEKGTLGEAQLENLGIWKLEYSEGHLSTRIILFSLEMNN